MLSRLYNKGRNKKRQVKRKRGKGKGGGLARGCLEEIKRKERGDGLEWEEDRTKFYEKRGYPSEKVEWRKKEGCDMRDEVEGRAKKI